MRVITGRVVGGRVEVEADVKEGTPVAILVAGESGFALTAEEEEELLDSLQQIRAGDFEDGYELLCELREMTRR